MRLYHWCLKIDKTNAKAMIEGFIKNNIRIHQSIWCAVMNRKFPMLITLNKLRTKFPMSRIGEALNSDNFEIPHKYVARLDSEYFIRNEMKLWEKICTNGLFDVWDPYAPYKRFEDAKSAPSNFRIQLLRLFEINEEFQDEEIRMVNDRIDHLIPHHREVSIKGPVIQDEEFSNIKNKLKESLEGFQIKHYYLSKYYVPPK